VILVIIKVQPDHPSPYTMHFTYIMPEGQTYEKAKFLLSQRLRVPEARIMAGVNNTLKVDLLPTECVHLICESAKEINGIQLDLVTCSVPTPTMIYRTRVEPPATVVPPAPATVVPTNEVVRIQ